LLFEKKSKLSKNVSSPWWQLHHLSSSTLATEFYHLLLRLLLCPLPLRVARNSCTASPHRQNGHRPFTTTSSPTAAGNRRTARWSVDTTPTPTETAKKFLAEGAKQHTEATKDNPYHRPSGCLSEMWWERTLGTRMSKSTSVILLGMRQSGCE